MVTEKGRPRFWPGKNIFRLRASNYDGNIYSYKSSHSPTQKVHSVKKNWVGNFAAECHEKTVLFLNKVETPHAKSRLQMR